MFKTAARKIAHNSVVPGLAGKTDLRTLQDLITAEKAVMNSYVKLALVIIEFGCDVETVVSSGCRNSAQTLLVLPMRCGYGGRAKEMTSE